MPRCTLAGQGVGDAGLLTMMRAMLGAVEECWMELVENTGVLRSERITEACLFTLHNVLHNFIQPRYGQFPSLAPLDPPRSMYHMTVRLKRRPGLCPSPYRV